MENKNITEELLIAYLEGDLSEEDSRELEQAIRQSETLSKKADQLKELLTLMEESSHVEPPKGLYEGIKKELETKTTSHYQRWMAVAAAVAMWILGYFSAGWFQSENTSELQALKQDVEHLQDLVLESQLAKPTASERIQAVNRIQESKKTDSNLIRVLLNTANTDESPNVRYAAIQALQEYMQLEEVRMGLVKSLEVQTDPLIQIAIINLLVAADEKAAIAPLRKINEDENTDPEVKKQADIAMEILI